MAAFRALGWLLLALAVAVVVHDLLTWWSEGSLAFSTLGGLWAHLDPGSLGSTQASTRRLLPGGLWNWTVRPYLALPALPSFLVLGFFFLWLGNRDGDRPDPSFLGGSRPSRRRRSRGLS